MQFTNVESPSSQGNGSISSKERKRFLLSKLNELASEIVTDIDKLQAFADQWRGGFHPYSFSNLMLIWSQKHDATLCTGFNQWKSKGRYVKKGERAIWILAPFFRHEIKYDAELGAEVESEEKTIATFFPVPVFDYSQTEGQELILGNSLVSGNGNLKIGDVSACFDVPVEFSQGISDGLTDGKKITVSKRENETQMIACYFHELAHILCCHFDEKRRYELSREIRELEAEATSFLVCSCLGIENEGAKYYIGHWQGDRAKIAKSALRILKTAERILRKVKPGAFEKFSSK